MSELLRDKKLTTSDMVNRQPVETNDGAASNSDAYANPHTDMRADAKYETRADSSHDKAAATGQPNPLFPEDELGNFRSSWDQVQTSFVDEPRAAVERADSLVANIVKRIAEQFASERQLLEKQWDRGESVNTEDLRQAFKRYRAFFDRLLAV
jgi:hypothetical protein